MMEILRDSKGRFVKGIIAVMKGRVNLKLRGNNNSSGKHNLSEEVRQQMKDRMTSRNKSDEFRKQRSVKEKENFKQNPARFYGLKMGRGEVASDKRAQLERRKHRSDKEYHERRVKELSRKRVPNKAEQTLMSILDEHFPNQWKYVGSGKLIIGGRIPDFVNIDGQKKLIELFGDYWHRNDDGQDRIHRFKDYGFNTLIVWEHELLDKGSLLEKLKEYTYG